MEINFSEVLYSLFLFYIPFFFEYLPFFTYNLSFSTDFRRWKESWWETLHQYPIVRGVDLLIILYVFVVSD